MSDNREWTVEVWAAITVQAETKGGAKLIVQRTLRAFDEYRIEHIS